MAASEDGADIFEITDFTTASDFERFVARLEELIHEWKLTSVPEFHFNDKRFDVDETQWRSISEEVMFINFPFIITHHYVTFASEKIEDNTLDELVDSRTGVCNAVKDQWPTTLRSIYHDTQPFPCKTHCICRWFGLTSFVVISPRSYALTDENQIKTILHAISLALHNSSCQLPIFLQSLDSQRMFYLGEYVSPGLSTSFDMVHLSHVPDRFRDLSGLLDLFKGKINIRVEPEPKALVSIRATYILQDWATYTSDWPQPLPADVVDGVALASVGWAGVSQLPFGTTRNPIENLHLYAMWFNMSEEVISDNQVHSDIDPMNAPIWTVQVTMAKGIDGLLHESLRKFSELCGSSATFDQVFGSRQQENLDSELTTALERLTEPQTRYNLPSMSKMSGAMDIRLRLNERTQQQSPIPVDVLNKILLHIFPDAKDYEEASEEAREETEIVNSAWGKEHFKFCKTAPIDSLLYRLAVSSCIANTSFGGLKAVAHLWHEIVLEMRFRLDNSLLIPGLESGLPDLSQGLLYQKLQMLNCCISRKSAREADQNELVMDASVSASNAESLSDDDEFFDCDSSSSSPSLVETADKSDLIPQGRLRKLENVKLLNGKDDLYIPITQDPAPMTEDALAEHAEILTRMGTSEDGANLRAKMQSASLVSDMESFKAANHGCVLDDFVRWYSPKDYVLKTFMDPDTGDIIEKGSLSDRMLVAGNVWQEAWRNAKPVPANRQKRLFNDTKEGEKVLHYLSNLKPSDVILQLLPLAIQSAILVLKEQGNRWIPSISSLITSLLSQLENCTHFITQSAELYADIIHTIHTAELLVSRARSLHLKFVSQELEQNNRNIDEFVSQLMNQQEVKVIGAARGPVGRTLTALFKDSKKKQNQGEHSLFHASQKQGPVDTGYESFFPLPAEREFLLRLATPRPAPYSLTLPQRMHCILNDREVRFCGAFSSDNIFK
ncbi:rab3 GTPase-activating protein catalytic subunit-like isoform X2 [Watersipora subatra]|uniref:rab3 GTPase-activating protein catalytic subunit-like isoform X2 n=1 Tax=Watersipora subatra TaxID=2589382 RepID=UPI00355BE271